VTTDGTQLPDSPHPSPDELRRELLVKNALVQQLLEQLDSAHRKISQMDHQLQQLLQRLYGKSSEKIDPRQRALFEELLGQIESRTPSVEEPVVESPPVVAEASVRRDDHGRRTLAPDLPRERVVHDLPEEEKPCPCCGTMRTLIGDETSEQMDFVPATLKVIEHVRLKYMCKACEKNAVPTGPQIVVADKPRWPVEKGLAAPGLIAHVGLSKYDDSMPLNRIEKSLRRNGIDLSRSTQWDIVRGGGDALIPLVGLMTDQTLHSKVIHTDDTPVTVLDRPNKTTYKGHFWVYVGDKDHPHVVFDYTPDRCRDGPVNFLRHWTRDGPRFLQADAYAGYDNLYTTQAGSPILEVACWAHARRRFFKCKDSDFRNSAQALAYIKLLYKIERDARELEPAERAALRQEHAAPLLEKFHTWLTDLQAVNGGPVLPKSPMGEAVTYVFNQWEALKVYVTDGDLNIDNNISENALRRVAIGRKNWMFLASDNGGRVAATWFTVIATCHRHQVNPFDYLRDVLARIPSHPHHRLHELLPHNWKPKP
jgi:transposase